jgi:hypothetical protein
MMRGWHGGGQMKRALLIFGNVALALTLAACASSSEQVTAADVSPATYQSYTCMQLSEEAQRLWPHGRSEYGRHRGALESILNVSVQKNCRDPILGGIGAILRQHVEISPKQEIADYVLPVQYQNHTCPRLNEEAKRLTARIEELTLTPEFQVARGAVFVTFLTLVYYPAGLIVHELTPAVIEINRLHEEHQTVIKVSIKKHCDFSRWRPWPQGRHPSLRVPFDSP